MRVYRFLVGLMLLIFGVAPMAWANNCGTCDSSIPGKICYATIEKKFYGCDGTKWNCLVAEGCPVPSTPCPGALGSDCGGGMFVGDTNLVIAKSGCRPCGGGGQPACLVPGDNHTCDGLQADGSNLLLKLGPASDPAYAAYSSGAVGTAALAGGTGRDAINFCANLIAGGKDDWFLPTINEIRFVRGHAAISSSPSFGNSYYVVAGEWWNGYNTVMSWVGATLNAPPYISMIGNADRNLGGLNQWNGLVQHLWGGQISYWTISNEPTNKCGQSNQCMLGFAPLGMGWSIWWHPFPFNWGPGGQGDWNGSSPAYNAAASYSGIESLPKSEQKYVRCMRRN